MLNLFWIFMGGGLGASARWGVSGLFKHSSLNFPWATFLCNGIGSLGLGLVMAWTLSKTPSSSSYLLPFLTIGFLGGFTTFSTLIFELQRLWLNENFIYATLYLFGSFLVGIVCLGLGLWLGQRFS